MKNNGFIRFFHLLFPAVHFGNFHNLLAGKTKGVKMGRYKAKKDKTVSELFRIKVIRPMIYITHFHLGNQLFDNSISETS